METFSRSSTTDIGESWFQGIIINMPFTDINRVLGNPHVSYTSGSKVQYEWVFNDSKGQPITVYDWKEYGNRSPSEWHVGGRSALVAQEFKRWFDEKSSQVL